MLTLLDNGELIGQADYTVSGNQSLNLQILMI